MQKLLLSARRSIAMACFIAFAWLLTYTLELRRTAYSCRTFGSCLGFTGRHRYHYPFHMDEQLVETGRSAIARLRNYLMLSGLKDEWHIVWLDADVVELSHGIVQTMMQHSENNKDAGIITAMCHQNRMNNYDKNAWKVNAPHLLGAIADSDRPSALRDLTDMRWMATDLLTSTDATSLVALDSVGGTVLYIRSDLIRQGLVFPYANMVGTTWSQYGWIGMETEGLCYMAKALDGGGCYILGGNHYIRHTDWG